MYNILIGGAAGDGIETMAGLLEKIIQRNGFFLFSMRDFMSRVRGGHNFAQIRFGSRPVYAHRDALDALVIFNVETYDLHKDELKDTGFVLSGGADVAHDSLVKIDAAKLAKQSGNPKTSGTVLVGALLRLFGLNMETGLQVYRENLPQKILDANLTALQLGYEVVTGHAEPIKANPSETMLLTGSESIALGALAGGLRFYSGYPMSPATTLLDFFQKHSDTFLVSAEQAEDEIAAANMAVGAAYAGARSMAGTSGGGFSLMVETLGFAGIAEIPVVFADIQRPGPATGFPTRTEQSDLLFVISAAQGEFPRMVIAVRDHEDAFYQTARALFLAEKYQLPVILLGDQYLADSSVTIPPLDTDKAKTFSQRTIDTGGNEGKTIYQRYAAAAKDGISPMRIPGKSAALVRADSDEHNEAGVITESAAVRIRMVDKRAAKLDGLRRELLEPNYFGPKTPHVLLVGFGSTQNALAEAVEILNGQGESVGALCFGDIYPLPVQKLTTYAQKAEKVINVEQNATGQLARLLKSEAMLACPDSILKYDGRQMSADYILDGFYEIQGRQEAEQT